MQVPEHVPLVALVRDGITESVHYGSYCVIDGSGAIIEASGDVHAPIYARSAAKPLQGVALVRAGLDALDSQLAVACSSHSGEAYHLDTVRSMLHAAGLSVDHLANTPALPYGEEAREEWLRGGGTATRLTQNCSGKHAAMLMTCVANRFPLGDYLALEHPLQRNIRDVFEEMTGTPNAAVSVDGCGAPLFATDLIGLARAFGRLATAPACTAERRVSDAMRTHPELVGGTTREITALLRAVEGLVAKDGAEGVAAGSLPDGRAIAIKIADGSDRARVLMLATILTRLGIIGDGLSALLTQPVYCGTSIRGSLHAL